MLTLLPMLDHIDPFYSDERVGLRALRIGHFPLFRFKLRKLNASNQNKLHRGPPEPRPITGIGMLLEKSGS